MGLKLAADFDLELFWSKLEKTLAERDKSLKEYLTRPHGDVRQLFATVPGAAAPVVLDLGAPAGGLLWSVQQVVCMPGVALVTTAIANVAAGIFLGGVPSSIAQGLDTAALVAAGLAVPFNYGTGGSSLVARQNQHLYVVLQGAGTATPSQYTVTATVLQVPDTPEALLWL